MLLQYENYTRLICVFILVMLFFWKTFADTHDQYVLLFLSCYNFENIYLKFLFIYLWTILLIAQQESLIIFALTIC